MNDQRKTEFQPTGQILWTGFIAIALAVVALDQAVVPHESPLSGGMLNTSSPQQIQASNRAPARSTERLRPLGASGTSRGWLADSSSVPRNAKALIQPSPVDIEILPDLPKGP